MKEETKQIAEAAITNSKLSWFVLFGMGVETWWVEWGSALFDIISTIVTITLGVGLIFLNYQKYKIAKRENEEAGKPKEEIKDSESEK